jgi:hypothetical protein
LHSAEIRKYSAQWGGCRDCAAAAHADLYSLNAAAQQNLCVDLSSG